MSAVKLQNASASFDQAGLPIASAIDGNRTNPGKGWALSPTTGVTHWATFETGSPVGKDGGTVLTIKLHQIYVGGIYTLGRFRLSATKVPKPLGLGLSEDYRAILEIVPELRSEAQRNTLVAFHRAIDPTYRSRVDALNASRGPLPTDPHLMDLRTRLEAVSKPVPLDPRLVALRADVEMSIKQSIDRRLTAAQDIAWALINSPSFLFNH